MKPIQASEVFTGGPRDASTLFISAINRHLNRDRLFMCPLNCGFYYKPK